MGTRKSLTLPIIITLVVIGVIVYLFASIKQTVVTCEKEFKFDSDVYLKETAVITLDKKKISKISVNKTIILPEKYTNEGNYISNLTSRLHDTLEYLGDNAIYSIGNDRIIVDINVSKDELVLLDNISFTVKDDLDMVINTNTKSKKSIVLTVGDTNTDGDIKNTLKKHGYSCK